MNIREELRINGHQPIVGRNGTDEGIIFENWISNYGFQNMHFICSMAFNLGRIQGIRGERAKRAVHHNKDQEGENSDRKR